jgi:hypothetical protein
MTQPSPERVAEMQQRFASFVDTAAARSPLYSRLAAGIAADPQVAALLCEAPRTQQSPVLLLAAVHHLLLSDPTQPLAALYPSVASAISNSPQPGGDSLWPSFREFALAHRDAIAELVSTRSTQTNEVGRCAQFLPLFAMVATETSKPIAQVDVGTSAGLTLLWPRYAYRYDGGGTIGAGTLRLDCASRNAWPIQLGRLPMSVAGIGIDPAPVGIDDHDERRWLRACIWPDQTDRLSRLDLALAIATEHPPDVLRGNAVDDVAATIRLQAEMGHPVVTTSWCLNYLTVDEQRAFVAELDRCAADVDLSWVVAEAPARTPGLPIPTAAEPEELTVLSLVTWRQGNRTVRRLATTHPHGYWLHWER